MISHLITIIVLTFFAMAAAGVYLLPVLIGWARHVPGLAAITVIDLLLGWTFAGWVIALVLALRRVYPTGPLVQVVQQQLPQPAPRPEWPADAGWAGPPGPPPARPDSPPPLPLPLHRVTPGTAGLPAATSGPQSGGIPGDADHD